MILESNDFPHEGMMDPKFTCDGTHIQPELHWSDFPAEAKSFAIACRDPDAKPVVGHTFTHWIIHNIPLHVNSIPQNSPLPAGAKLVQNDSGQMNYYGPCPPPGTGTHHYQFTVYALDCETLEGVTPANYLEMFEERSLAKATYIGIYTRDE